MYEKISTHIFTNIVIFLNFLILKCHGNVQCYKIWTNLMVLTVSDSNGEHPWMQKKNIEFKTFYVNINYFVQWHV